MGGPEASGSDLWFGRARERIKPMCEACVSRVQVDGGGVALLSSAGVRAVVYTSDESSMALEELQMDLAEGPCVDAGAARAPVLVGDIHDPGEGVAERWPFFLARAEELGIRGVFAFPLRIGSIVLGTMELYRTTAGPLDGKQINDALSSADDMGAAILDLRHPVALDDLDGLDGLDGLGPPAAAVHQAAGMVMVQLGSSIDEAMAQLRARAFSEGVSLKHLSAEILSGRRRFTKEES
jgi:GAF domain-containing protein